VLLVPLDVGRWAVISGGKPELRRRIAAELRALSHRRAGARTREPILTLDAA